MNNDMKKIFKSFLTSYAERDQAVDFSDWLAGRLQQEMPDMTDVECENLSREIIEGIAQYNQALDDVGNAMAEGQSKEEWAADQMAEAYAAMVIRLSATYGLRRSEVLGLKWSAVDWKRKTIVIQHTVVRVGSKTVRDDTVKEAASYRTMPLTVDIEEYLKKLYAHQKQMKKLCKSGYMDSDYICKWDNGKLFDPNYITRKFRQILKAKNLPKIRFHDLRHSSASLLINMGFTLKEVQEWLGHADIASTEIYSHLLYKSKENMADKINRALSTRNATDSENRAVANS